jgi:hypothetical protein
MQKIYDPQIVVGFYYKRISKQVDLHVKNTAGYIPVHLRKWTPTIYSSCCGKRVKITWATLSFPPFFFTLQLWHPDYWPFIMGILPSNRRKTINLSLECEFFGHVSPEESYSHHSRPSCSWICPYVPHKVSLPLCYPEGCQVKTTSSLLNYYIAVLLYV